MRKQIRKAAGNPYNGWLPGFDPKEFNADDDSPSFDNVVSVALPANDRTPDPLPTARSTPPLPVSPLPQASPQELDAQFAPTGHTAGDSDLVSQESVVAGLEQMNPDLISRPVSVIWPRPLRVMDSAHNFSFGQEFSFAASPVARFDSNVAAICLARDLSTSRSAATPDDMLVLARYSGWGGLSEAFGGKADKWQSRRDQLRSLLQEAEYDSARSSVLNAHYTDPAIIRWMFDAVTKMGFASGRVLDPSTGIGHFIGAMPAALRARCQITGVELDPTSAKIASLLYPDAQLHASGLESADLPDQSFDLVISNVPFGDYTIYDPALRGVNLLVHDYFFVKAAALVRPGGIIAFITSTGTLDKVSKNARTRIRGACDLLGAFRLPSNVFDSIAGTTVTTDVIFLRRREAGDLQGDVKWLDTTSIVLPQGQNTQINEYFAERPQNVLGTITLESRGRHQVLNVTDVGNLDAQLQATLDRLPVGAYKERKLSAPQPAMNLRLDSTQKANSFCFVDGVIMRVGSDGYTATPVAGLGEKSKARVAGMIRVRDAMKAVLRTQVDDCSDDQIKKAIAVLNEQYDSFVSHHGILHDRQNRRCFKGDPDLPSLLALEDYDDEAGSASKMAIFERRTIMPAIAPSEVATVDDAFLVSLNWKGGIDPTFIAGLLKHKAWQEIATELTAKGLAWLNPETQGWEPREVYLGGNVRKKLKAARLASLTDPYFNSHVSALESIVPVDLEPSEIAANLGAAWIPDDVVLGFIQDMLATDKITLKHSLPSASWKVEFEATTSALIRDNVQNTATWGTSRITGMELVNDALNQVTTTIYDHLEDNVSVVNERETMLAREKVAEIRNRFREWIWGEDSRCARLARLYNDEFNSTVLPVYSGAHLTFPGMSDAIRPRPYQADVVWRYLCGGNLLVAHCVGAGKTAEAIIANMEARRLGIFKKILYVVPNHMLEDYAAEFLRIYPAANLLCASKEDLVGDKRRELLARVSTGSWDGVIVTQASFEKLGLSAKHLSGFIEDELSRLDEAIADAWSDGDRTIAKRLEGVRKSVTAKLSKLTDSGAKDGNIFFDDLGVDALVYDESQAIKNLFYSTKISRVAGLPNSVSRRALDAYSKILYIQAKHGGTKGVMFTTATPIANSMAEMFTVQRYLSRSLLREHDLDSFDAWAATFGRIVSSMEVSPDGGGFRMNNRFAQFVNLPELMRMFGSIADVKTREEIKLPVPAIAGGKPHVIVAKPSEALRAVVSELVARAERIRRGGVKPHEDNMLAVTGDGRRAALDLRLHCPAALDYEGSKVNLAVRQVFAIWSATALERKTQLVFCDMSTPKKFGFSVYNDMKQKWIALGIPEEEIAFIHDYDTDEKKAGLFRRVRKGIVRILLGSTAKMGVGTNVQRLLAAIHHLDSPWRPDEVEQRDGRGLRPGNLNDELAIYRYVTESTFDAYMWQTLESKALFVAQVMSPGCKVRSAEDVVVAALTYAEVKAIATGNPLFLRKAEVDAAVAKISIKKRDHDSSVDRAKRELVGFDHRISMARLTLDRARTDDQLRSAASQRPFLMSLNGVDIEDSKAATEVLQRVMINAAGREWRRGESHSIGRIFGFEVVLETSSWSAPAYVLRGALDHSVNDVDSRALALLNAIRRVSERLATEERNVWELEQRHDALKLRSVSRFVDQEEMVQLWKSQTEIYAALGLSSDQVQAGAVMAGDNDVELLVMEE
jgi:N12 class adenine-specific DNA methylase